MSEIDNATGTVAQSPTVAPAPSGAEPPAPTTGPADTAVPGDAQQPQAQEQRPPRNRSVERRISRLTQDRDAAIREAGYWRGLAEGRTPQATEQQPTGEPQHAPTQGRSSQPSAAEVRAHEAQVEYVLDRLREDGGEEIEDVIDQISAPSFPMSRTMRDYLGESKVPAAVAKHLADNPGEALRIAHLDPAVAGKALERLEARLSARPAPRTTNTPPPPPTVNGRSTPQFDPEKASMDDYATYWTERRAKAGYR